MCCSEQHTNLSFVYYTLFARAHTRTPHSHLSHQLLVFAVSATALEISEKQRLRLQQQTMAMTQYCALMADRARVMLRFIDEECPHERGDVLTAFRHKYPHYGLRQITFSVASKLGNLATCTHTRDNTHTTTTTTTGIKDPDTFTRWRKFYMSNGCFQPDRRGRFSSGFLLRHDDLKLELTKWLLGRLKRDINISDVRISCFLPCLLTYTHKHTHAYTC